MAVSPATVQVNRDASSPASVHEYVPKVSGSVSVNESTAVVPSGTSGAVLDEPYTGATSLTSMTAMLKLVSAVDPSALAALIVMLHSVDVS